MTDQEIIESFTDAELDTVRDAIVCAISLRVSVDKLPADRQEDFATLVGELAAEHSTDELQEAYRQTTAETSRRQ